MSSFQVQKPPKNSTCFQIWNYVKCASHAPKYFILFYFYFIVLHFLCLFFSLFARRSSEIEPGYSRDIPTFPAAKIHIHHPNFLFYLYTLLFFKIKISFHHPRTKASPSHINYHQSSLTKLSTKIQFYFAWNFVVTITLAPSRNLPILETRRFEILDYL